MDVTTTRLRYVRSKDPDKLVEYTNRLIGYKVEIKGNPTYSKGKWYLWFIIPDNVLKDFIGDLD